MALKRSASNSSNFFALLNSKNIYFEFLLFRDLAKVIRGMVKSYLLVIC